VLETVKDGSEGANAATLNQVCPPERHVGHAEVLAQLGSVLGQCESVERPGEAQRNDAIFRCERRRLE
jgi:hypothetical protein